jgi:hypothetical protein
VFITPARLLYKKSKLLPVGWRLSVHDFRGSKHL